MKILKKVGHNFPSIIGLAIIGLLAVSELSSFGQPVNLTVFDNFNDGNDSASPAWTRYNPILGGSWSFPGGNSYRIQAAASPDPVNFGPGRAGALLPSVYTNFYAAVDVLAWDDNQRQVIGILARLSNIGAGTSSGYFFVYNRGDPANPTGGDVDLVRLDGEYPTTLTAVGNDTIHFQPGNHYRIVFMGNGSDLRGQVYQFPDLSNPVIDITASDPTYGLGQVGLAVANDQRPVPNGTADATFDNYFATTAEPRITSTLSGGAVTLTWPNIPFSLQSATNLNSPVWTNVTSGITTTDDQNTYTISSPAGSQYFRLSYP